MRLSRSRWLVAILVVLLLAEGSARILGHHISAVDERGDPELTAKDLTIKQLAHEPKSSPTRPQVVTFGNSMMDGGFIPSVFAATRGGAPAYNAGFLNAPLVTIAGWGKLVLGQLKPQTAIVMIDPLDTITGNVAFGENGGTLGPSFKDALSQIDPGPFERATRQVEKVSALVKYRASLRQPDELWDAFEGALHHRPRPLPQRIDQAAPLHDINWSVELDPQGWDKRFVGAPPLAANAKFPLSFVGALIRDTTFDDSPVRSVFQAMKAAPHAVMVIPPVCTAILDRSGIPADLVAARAKELISIAHQEGVRVIDFSHADFPPALFADPVHLNPDGAKLFSRELALALAR